MTEPNIAFGDLETTGLVGHQNHILELAFIVTDSQLNVLDDEGFHRIVGYTPSEIRVLWSEADPYVRDMHQKTGLWDKLGLGTPLADIDDELLEYLRSFGDDTRTIPFGGNSNRLDFAFIDFWLPKTAAFLAYRMRDVSGLAGFVHDWYPDEEWFEKKSDHTAQMDIQECIREAQYYRGRLAARAIEDYLRAEAAKVAAEVDAQIESEALSR